MPCQWQTKRGGGRWVVRPGYREDGVRITSIDKKKELLINNIYIYFIFILFIY